MHLPTDGVIFLPPVAESASVGVLRWDQNGIRFGCLTAIMRPSINSG
jgi:hypothetical protein